MPVYKDEKRNTWFCKCNYKDWLGESKSKMKRGFATKKDAQQWERDFLQKQSASMDMKFASFAEVYFEDKAPRLKERSIMTKRTLFETKIIPYFGEKQMNEITAVDIIKWQNALLNQDYKPTYLRMIQNQMTALFNHAEKFYDLKDNPCKKVDKMGRPNAKELNFWTKDEYEQFIQGFSTDEEMYRIIFQMLFWLGCRVGELLFQKVGQKVTSFSKRWVKKWRHFSKRETKVTHLLIEDFRLVWHKKYFPEGAPTYSCEYRLLVVDFTKCWYEQMYPRSSDGTLAPFVFGAPPNQ